MGAVIETNGLTKCYGKSRGIVDVNLQVEEGEVFGFIGPNGAGKSTTIRLLLSLIRKTSGEATVFGLDCEKDSVRILADVGYLPSEVFYYDHMVVPSGISVLATRRHLRHHVDDGPRWEEVRVRDREGQDSRPSEAVLDVVPLGAVGPPAIMGPCPRRRWFSKPRSSSEWFAVSTAIARSGATSSVAVFPPRVPTSSLLVPAK